MLIFLTAKTLIQAVQGKQSLENVSPCFKGFLALNPAVSAISWLNAQPGRCDRGFLLDHFVPDHPINGRAAITACRSSAAWDSNESDLEDHSSLRLL